MYKFSEKVITFDSSKNYEFRWCEIKKCREAGVGFLIPGDHIMIVNETNVSDPQIIAVGLKILGFNIRFVNVYSPTEPDSESEKDLFYRLLNKTC